MDPKVCLENAKSYDPSAVLCSDSRCNGGASKYLNARCHCSGPYKEKDGKCPYTADSPVWIDDNTPNGCYCCCSCFAYGTPVAYAKQAFKPIEQYVVGDTVLVATRDLTWEERPVEFSQGVKPSEENGKTVITVYYRLGAEDRALVVTPDHVFFLASRHLKRAKELQPGVDQLLNAETGEAVAIHGTEMGKWYKGLHHIATSNDTSKEADYHLLNSNGVITGDWALQVSKLPDGVATAAATAPKLAVGRAAFQQLHGNFDPVALRPHGFEPFSLDAMQVPHNAQSFFSAEQAEELLNSGHVLHHEHVGIQEPLFYVFRQLHYYYDNVFYDVVWEEDTPNIYSFVQHGVKFVVITGGMARIDCMNMSGLYMVLASATSRFVGGTPLVPKTTYEVSCLGQADYFATLAALRNVLFSTDYRTHTAAGLEVLRTAFGYLSDNASGMPGNRCNHIGLDCRLQAFEAGRAMAALPWCAGGPAIDYLQVKSARRKQNDDGTAEVTIQFNQPLDIASACEPENYRFQPTATVIEVNMLLGSKNTVVVSCALDAPLDYRLAMTNIMSADGDFFENDRAEVTLRSQA
jgi:hypothetical protein